MGRGADIAVVVLAAGRGTRMKSGRAKVLHEIAGRPMLGFVLDAAEALAPKHLVVVVGRDGDAVRERFGGRATFVTQPEQRGTGDAAIQAKQALAGFQGPVLILYGDTPLLRAETLQSMVEVRERTGAPLVMLTARLPLPGRVVRDAEGNVQRIVEVTDATPAELALEEGNTGVYLVDAEPLWEKLSGLGAHNRQGELYLTDIVASLVADGRRVEAVSLEDPEESLGVNTRAELAAATACVHRRKAESLMASGVTFVDPAATYVDVEVEVGSDTVIEPGCVISGATRIGSHVHVRAHSVIESSQLEDGVVVGPMAHLRPGSRLRRGVRVGNFVEVKNSDLGEGVKADHLSYIGDADVGPGASFGCGSVVVNYDGVSKHRTTIAEGVFVGCNANLVAPITLGRDAFVAAGSTLTKDVPSEALGVARARQRNVEGWRKRRDERRKRE